MQYKRLTAVVISLFIVGCGGRDSRLRVNQGNATIPSDCATRLSATLSSPDTEMVAGESVEWQVTASGCSGFYVVTNSDGSQIQFQGNTASFQKIYPSEGNYQESVRVSALGSNGQVLDQVVASSSMFEVAVNCELTTCSEETSGETPALPAQIVEFVANPTTVPFGGSVELTLSTLNATSAAIDGGAVSVPVGRVVVTPTQTGAHEVDAVAVSPAGSQIRVASFLVNPVCQLSAAPGSFGIVGAPFQVGVQIAGQITGGSFAGPGIQPLQFNGAIPPVVNIVPTAAGNQPIRLMIAGAPPSGANCEIVIPVVEPPMVDIKANNSDGPVTVAYERGVHLTWTSRTASNCVISPTVGGVGTSGSFQIDSIRSSITYTIRCDSPTGQVTDSVVVGNPACSGARVNGSEGCWYLGGSGQSCSAVCGAHNGYHGDTDSFAGAGGNLTQCNRVMDSVGGGNQYNADINVPSIALGCSLINGTGIRYRWTGSNAGYGLAGYRRACACQN